jgi:DNA-binding phage protein
VTKKKKLTGIRKAIVNQGSSFESFLEEEGVLDAVDEAAVKRVLSWQIEQEMAAKRIGKSELARRMATSRTQVDRLLDPRNTGVSLHTIHKAVSVLGKRLQIVLDEPDAA